MARRPNRLIHEKSPYLRQHAHNPVDWHPWGEEAFERARREDRPIFLSIGYATCHWCHVMERESFEDPQVARILNEGFVPVKVDREERPDVDQVYMEACLRMTGHGGWPLTLVLTPDGRPFFAATYLPRESRFGRIGLLDLLPQLLEAWRTRRAEVEAVAREATRVLKAAQAPRDGTAPDEAVLWAAYRQLRAGYDPVWGGFGQAPKFPTPHLLTFLLRFWARTGAEEAREVVRRTLEGMRLGGIYDQLGFGFHRYSTDARWILPHFEKMLYDQALLLLAYGEGWQATGEPLFARTVRETVAYLLERLRAPEGAFYSAEDADSEGEEGRYYLWTLEEVRQALPPDEAELAVRLFHLEEEGNVREEATGRRTGRNVLYLGRPLAERARELGMGAAELAARLEGIRRRLLEARRARVRPALDDQILTDWNGLAVAALARAGRVFGEPAWVAAAEEAARFLLTHLRRPDGTLLHRYREGEAAVEGFLDDHAFLAWGLLELYGATFQAAWLEAALELAERLLERFQDPAGGPLFRSAAAGRLPVRPRELRDGAYPSGNSVSFGVLVRLGRLTGSSRLEEEAARLAAAFGPAVRRAPTAYAAFLAEWTFALGPAAEAVLVGRPEDPAFQALRRTLEEGYRPNLQILHRPPGPAPAIVRLAPFTAPMTAPDGRARVYLCRGGACELPTDDPERIRAWLGLLGPTASEGPAAEPA